MKDTNTGYLKGVPEILRDLPAIILKDIIIEFLKSSRYSLEGRRQLQALLRNSIPKETKYQLFPGQYISAYAFNMLRDTDWSHCISAVVEIGYHLKGEGSLIEVAIETDKYLTEVGLSELKKSYVGKRGKNLLSILLLGGFDFRCTKTDKGVTKKVVTLVKGTELLNLDARIDMAMDRCKHMGVFDDKTEITMATKTLDDLI